MQGVPVLQKIAQVLAILLLSPLLCKEIVVPQTASWVFWSAPVVAFAAMLTMPILVPVSTNYLPSSSDMGDILGSGLILTLGGFAILLAGPVP